MATSRAQKRGRAGRPRAERPETVQEWLNGQIDWYDRKGSVNQRWFKWSKGVVIVLAVSIPILAEYGEIPGYADTRALLVSLAAGGILLLEGLQQINKWQENWILYRSTCEALRHEKYMFAQKAGPYANLRGGAAERVLAERVGGLVSAEHATWSTAHREKIDTHSG